MTFEQFKKDFLEFLSDSNVNLGRLHSKTRNVFLSKAAEKFNNFVDKKDDDISKQKKEVKDGRIICLEPGNNLNIGKGVHAMTPAESMKADEQRRGSAPKSTKKRKQ